MELIEAERAARDERSRRLGARIVPVAKLVLAALLLSVVLRTLLIEPFAIPSGSMAPGLMAGDFIFVDKSAYGWSRASLPVGDQFASGDEWRVAAKPINRGDVVVFVQGSGQDYVKRVIGIGGDRVELRRGQLILNGVVQPCLETGRESHCREYLPGTTGHIIREDGTAALSDYDETLVPEGYLFVLGDNRDSSADSRVPTAEGGVGLVGEWQVIGMAKRIFFSVGEAIRWDRMGRRID